MSELMFNNHGSWDRLASSKFWLRLSLVLISKVSFGTNCTIANRMCRTWSVMYQIECTVWDAEDAHPWFIWRFAISVIKLAQFKVTWENICVFIFSLLTQIEREPLLGLMRTLTTLHSCTFAVGSQVCSRLSWNFAKNFGAVCITETNALVSEIGVDWPFANNVSGIKL